MWPFKKKSSKLVSYDLRNNGIITETNKKKSTKFPNVNKCIRGLCRSIWINNQLIGSSSTVVAPLYFLEWNIQYSKFKCVAFYKIQFKYSYAFLQHHNIVLLSIFDTVFFRMNDKKTATNFHMKNVDIESYFVYVLLYCYSQIFFPSPRQWYNSCDFVCLFGYLNSVFASGNISSSR